jgi:hypothetical protein
MARMTGTIELDGQSITFEQGGDATTLAAGAAASDITVTLPAVTSTLSTLAGTETLTNKTLTSPKLNENVAVTTTATKLNYLTSATGTTGTASTNVVFSTSPTLVTPTIGAASATSVNKVAITEPASAATLTLADGSTLVTSGANSITLTSTGATNVTLPTSGTLYGTAAGSITSAQLASSLTNETGSGVVVFNDTPTLVTPVLGVASATTINKVTLTAPATGSTLTVADGKTLTASNTLTLTGTDGSSAAFGAGGTVAYTANKLSAFAATTSAELAGVVSDETGSGALVFATSPALTTPTVATRMNMLAAGAIRFNDSDDTNYAAIKAPATIAADYTLTLPTTDGSSGEVLTTDGSGALSWTAPLTNPMTTEGDVIIGGASGATTRLAIGTANQLLRVNAGATAPEWASTLAGLTLNNTNTITVQDANFTLQDNSDNTKQLKFELSGIASGNTRTLTVPNVNDTLVTLDASQTLQNKTFVTPVLGAASATSINRLTITQPATGSTLTIADGKTLTASNTLTFTGTDSSSVAFGAGGIVAYTGATLAQFAATTSLQLKNLISDETGSGALVFATSPTLVTPVLGAATGTSLDLTGSLTVQDDIEIGSSATPISSSSSAYKGIGNKKNSILLSDSFATGQTYILGGGYFDGGSKYSTLNTTAARFLVTETSATTSDSFVWSVGQSVSHAADAAATFTQIGSATGAGSWTLGNSAYNGVHTINGSVHIGTTAGAAGYAAGTYKVIGNVKNQIMLSDSATNGEYYLSAGGYYNGSDFVYGVTGSTYIRQAMITRATRSSTNQFFWEIGTSDTATAGDVVTADIVGAISGLGLWTIGKSGETGAHTLNGNLTISGLSSGGQAITATTAINGGTAYYFEATGTNINASNDILMGLRFLSDSDTTNAYFVSCGDSDNNPMGGIYASSATAVAFGVSSDARLKTNKRPIEYSLATVNQLQPKHYEWIADNSTDFGFIAQELAEVVPKAVRVPSNEEDTWIVNYTQLIPILTKAIQELSAKNDALQARIEALENA